LQDDITHTPEEDGQNSVNECCEVVITVDIIVCEISIAAEKEHQAKDCNGKS
jgi:hypothetical protein